MLYFVVLPLLSHPYTNVSSTPAPAFFRHSENQRQPRTNVLFNREEPTMRDGLGENLTPGGLRALIIESARIIPPGTCTCHDRNASRAFSTTMPDARRYDVARSNGPLFASLSLHSRGRYLLRLGRGRGSQLHRRNRLDRFASLGPTVNRPRGGNARSLSLSLSLSLSFSFPPFPPPAKNRLLLSLLSPALDRPTPI